MKQQIEFENNNPFRRPDWRMERVLQIIDRAEHPGRSTKRDDKYVKALRNFILRYRGSEGDARQRLGYENPGLFWAFQIYDERDGRAGRKAMMLESRILARQNNVEIAKELRTIPEVVDYYSHLFFDVREGLDSHDWVVDDVLMPAYDEAQQTEQQAGTASDETPDGVTPHVRKPLAEPYFDATLKFFAYFGGALILDFAITGFRRDMIAHQREDVGEWWDQHWMNRLKQRSATAAQTFQVNRYNVMALFETHKEIIAIQRSAQNEESRQDAVHKAVRVMMEGLKWAVGKEGRALVEGTAVVKYDSGAAELRDNELTMVAAGHDPGTIEGVETLTMPPPRKRSKGQEDHQHANAQQGS